MGRREKEGLGLIFEVGPWDTKDQGVIAREVSGSRADESGDLCGQQRCCLMFRIVH